MSSLSWFIKPKGLNSEGEKLWSTINKPQASRGYHKNYCLYLDIAKELDEFSCWKHFSFESDYKNFNRERERYRLYYSITTADELDVEKLIEAVVSLQLQIEEQEKEIESLKDEIRNRFE
jgi:hypothetical protein